MNGLEKLSLHAPMALRRGMKLIRRDIVADPMASAMRAMARIPKMKGMRFGSPASIGYKAYLSAMPKPVGMVKSFLKTLAEGASAGGLLGLTAGTIGTNLLAAAKAKKLKGGKAELPSKKEMVDAAMASIGEAVMSRF